MKRWADSESVPTDGQLAQAKAAGYDGWAGGFAGPGIAYNWSDADFERVLAAGLSTLAFCSGWADPAQMSDRAAALGIPGCLDDESGIRPHGTWVQPWLDTSGFGQYGNGPVHRGITAAFHICSGYPGYDPQETWPSDLEWKDFGWGVAMTRPALCGWQWHGTYASPWSINIDISWYDDNLVTAGFGGSEVLDPNDPTVVKILAAAAQLDTLYKFFVSAGADPRWLELLNGKTYAVAAGSGGLTAQQAQELTDALATLQRLEAGLKAA